MNKIFPRILEKFFINKTSQHLYNPRGNSLDVLQVKTTTYGSNSFILHAIRSWNLFQNKANITISLPELTPTKKVRYHKTNLKDSRFRTFLLH